jgi:hypothetical protein
MNKETFANLIDAYADAKMSKNKHLLNTMVGQLQAALDEVFAAAEPEEEETSDVAEF